ncbi:MAG: cobalt-precorrin 5A hydrolase [Bacilli bacterium]
MYILSFTSKGYTLSERLKQIPEYEVEIIRVKNLNEVIDKVFKKNNTIVFIGAIGIAVRGISSFIEHKSKDPAVIVIDEKGKVVIPILSGHLGGANDASLDLSKYLNAKAIITTATDTNNVFSIDLYARHNDYHIANCEDIKLVSKELLELKDVGLKSDYEIEGVIPQNFILDTICSANVYFGMKSSLPNTLVLQPKMYHIGIGCKKDTDSAKLENFFLETLSNQNIDVNLVKSIASIDLKKNEKAIINLSEKYNLNFSTYTKEELAKYENLFESSEFVKSITGVSNVCESAAFLAAEKGKIILSKKVKDGMTIAIAIKNWKVKF